MIDVRQGGPGEIMVELTKVPGEMAWGDAFFPPYLQAGHLTLWFDTKWALDLANKLMDIVQAMDDTEREREP